MKPTTARALKTGAQAITQLPLSNGNISSDNLLTETIVTVLTAYSIAFIASVAQSTTAGDAAASNTATLITKVPH